MPLPVREQQISALAGSILITGFRSVMKLKVPTVLCDWFVSDNSVNCIADREKKNDQVAYSGFNYSVVSNRSYANLQPFYPGKHPR